MSEWKMEDINVLGSIIDSSFGRSSINDAGYGVKASLAGSKSTDVGTNPVLEIRFETLVNFNPRHGMQTQLKEVNRQCDKMLTEKITEIKRTFKENSGKSLKANQLFTQKEPRVDHISHNLDLVRARYSRLVQYELKV